MAYLQQSELSSVIRDYQLEAIVDGDDSLVDDAIEAAIDEVSEIFTPSNKKIWEDGRPIYDVTAIFAATGTDRNGLMLARVKIITIWHLIGLCNTGLVYKDAQDRYDRAVAKLNDLADGTTTSPSLPKIIIIPPDTQLPFQSGSRCKFHHE